MEREYLEYTVRDHKIAVGKFYKPLSVTDAYIIGRIAADGAYTFNHAKRFVRMGISAKDMKFLIRLTEIYMPNTTPINRDGRNITVNNGYKDYHYITEGHGELHFPIRFTDQLRVHGIVCHKAERVIAGIPDSLFSSAILGFLDGDGSIIVRHRKDCRTPRLNVVFVSSAYKILTHIQRHLENRLGVSSSLHIHGKSKSWRLRVENTTSAIKLCEWLYSSMPEIYCVKKKAIFDRYMSCVRLGEFGEGRKG